MAAIRLMAEVCPGHHLRCRMEVWLQGKMYKSPVIEDQPTQTNQPNSTLHSTYTGACQRDTFRRHRDVYKVRGRGCDLLD